MILFDARIGNEPGYKHLHLQDGLVRSVTARREELEPADGEVVAELNGARVLPGFINSHDHLDFNLYPPLRNRQYADYTEWGKDIHHTHAALIKGIEAVPQQLRIRWGLYKSLLNGFTTVVNHGAKLTTGDDLVDVYQDCDCLHSPAFEKNWRLKLNRPFRKKKPVVMHIGEGTNEAAHSEISEVIKANLFSRKIMAVHGVAMDEKQAASFAALIWCPSSNYFLLGKTAAVEKLKPAGGILFGTDSTLTSPWAAPDHFHDALASGKINEEELEAMLTHNAAAAWGFDKKGIIAPGMKADLLVKCNGKIFEKTAFDIVIHDGRIKMLSNAITGQLKGFSSAGYEEIALHGQPVFVIKGILQLVKELQTFYPEMELPFQLPIKQHA